MPAQQFPLSSSRFNDFSAVIVTAFQAHMVREFWFVASRTFYIVRSFQLPIRTASVFLLGAAKVYTSSIDLKFNNGASLGSTQNLLQLHSPSFKFFPQTGHSPLQSALHRF